MPKTALVAPALRDLKPYRSFLILRLTQAGLAKPFVVSLRNALMESAKKLRGFSEAAPGKKTLTENELTTAYFVYCRQTQPAWAVSDEFVDRSYHLAVVSGYKGLVAVFASDPGLREHLRSALTDEDDDLLADFEAVPPSRLNAALVKGRTKTLWLSGTHRQTTLKADNKILSGSNLQDALDPLGDQSYVFTAARCSNRLKKGRVSYGVAPGKSAWWLSPSKNWDEYRDTALEILEIVDTCRTDDDTPLPVLSSAISGAIDPAALGEVFEISQVPIEALDPAAAGEADAPPPDPRELQLDVVSSDVPSFTADLSNELGQGIGRCRFTLGLEDAARITWVVDAAPGGPEPDAAVVQDIQRQARRLKVSFDRGYAITDSAMYSVRYRDIPFDGFEWAEFDGYDLSKEKPSPFNALTIGATDSLFCWIRTKWQDGALPWLPANCWLACNDGSNEIADFVCFDDVDGRLTLVHVKHSKNTDIARPISVGPFELVVSQAVKNLRYLDSQNTADEFADRVNQNVRDAVWRNGQQVGRQAMVDAIVRYGAALKRKVVVVQPNTRRLAREQALTAAPASLNRLRIRQLHTLLQGVERDCQALGADFTVVAHDG